MAMVALILWVRGVGRAGTLSPTAARSYLPVATSVYPHAPCEPCDNSTFQVGEGRSGSIPLANLYHVIVQSKKQNKLYQNMARYNTS